MKLTAETIENIFGSIWSRNLFLKVSDSFETFFLKSLKIPLNFVHPHLFDASWDWIKEKVRVQENARIGKERGREKKTIFDIFIEQLIQWVTRIHWVPIYTLTAPLTLLQDLTESVSIELIQTKAYNVSHKYIHNAAIEHQIIMFINIKIHIFYIVWREKNIPWSIVIWNVQSMEKIVEEFIRYWFI